MRLTRLCVAGVVLAFSVMGCSSPSTGTREEVTQTSDGGADADGRADLCGDLRGDWQEVVDLVALEVDLRDDSDGLEPDAPDLPVDLDVADEDGGIPAWPGQVLVTELMVAPVAAPAPAGQWLELLNAGEEALTLAGWEIGDGTGTWQPLALDSGQNLAPGAFLVVGFEANPEWNGGITPDLVIPGLDLEAGVIVLRGPAEEVEVDRVDWAAAGEWPLFSGASLSLDPEASDAEANDDPANWCSGATPYGNGDLGSPGAVNPSCPPPEVCGDLEINAEEQCDDGRNGDDADGCRDDCTWSCSDPAMDCDDPAGDCLEAVCEEGGFGMLCGTIPADDPPDDENSCTTDLCDQGAALHVPVADGNPCGDEAIGGYCVEGTCAAPVCGDGIVGPLEACDDGNLQDGDGCSALCSIEECGNGLVEGQEQCDDGQNGDDADGCRDDCTWSCSDPATDCDDPAGDCLEAVCEEGGSGMLCGTIPADDPPDDENSCTTDSCTDGLPAHTPLPDGSLCDAEGCVVGKYCVDGICIEPVCGDGIAGLTEPCDDGNDDPCDGCLPSCELHMNTCGDGFLCPPEACDDGNEEGGDGCSALCTVEHCGNGLVEGQEQCDDGQNGDDADGCRDDCTWSCLDPVADCADPPGDCLEPICEPGGFGVLCGTTPTDDPPDDDNPCTADLCDQGLVLHLSVADGTPCGDDGPGHYCADGTCIEPVCGDGIIGPTEACDDGNQQDGDGCSALCTLEECGNGLAEGQEQCDDGQNGDDTDGCRDDCTWSCQDPAIDCADAPGDCLEAICEPGGLGVICGTTPTNDPPDDENACTTDLCDQGLVLHLPVADGTPCGDDGPGHYCADGTCIEPVCGDGIIGPTEACDDGNQQDGDGCSALCELESGSECPEDMVFVPANPAMGVETAFCMDRYEASRPDASAYSQGNQDSIALSKAGVLPWFENPFVGSVHLPLFESACQAAGKRLCEKNEWFYSCAGSDNNTYVWGNDWDKEVCNCVDTWCDDYCEENNITPVVNGSGCGYSLYYTYPQYGSPFYPVPTGSMTGCVDEFGAYDVNGNVWEVIPSTTSPYGWDFEVRGGAFNCGGAWLRLQCTFSANWTSLYAGFRCCKDL